MNCDLVARGLLIAILAVAPMTAAAFDTAPRRYGTSTAPYWEVGNINRELSSYCRAGQFNQKRIAELYFSFVGEKGSGLLGIAKRDYNLRDPQGKALPDVSYYFYSDGTSQCKVYTAP